MWHSTKQNYVPQLIGIDTINISMTKLVIHPLFTVYFIFFLPLALQGSTYALPFSPIPKYLNDNFVLVLSICITKF